ncbi:MAG: tyrosine-type recombinase/integrase [Cypionkella sp.]
MPALPIDVKYVVTDAQGRYRYNRHVPLDCREALGKRMWNLSLGREFAPAVAKAVATRQEHDDLIARLRNPDSSRIATSEVREIRVGKATKRTSSRIAALEKAEAPDGAEDDTPASVEAVLGAMWQRVPAILSDAEDEPDPVLRHRRLAGFMVMAFGDQSHGSVDQRPDLPAPTGKTDAKLYATYRAMLREALEELSPTPDTTPAEMMLSGLIARYAKAQAARANTIRSYTNKAKRLITYAGNHGLQHYDEAVMRDYRDHLIAGVPDPDPKLNIEPVKPVTVHQYFAPLKAMWKWAADEYPEHKKLTFPRIRLPKDGDTVEETRWQAFDEKQIKEVWRLVNEAWGPNAKSKLSPSRRKAFLMTIRVLLYTGMRPSEVFRLTAADVSNGIISIRYTKTKTPRKIPLSVHIADFPDFLAEGGFAAELEAGMTAMRRGKVYGKPTTPQSLAGTLSDNFAPIIRAGGLTNDRHVCYSCKDTLIDRLQQQGASDDVMRGIIGHVGGQGKLRHYKTPFGHSPHGMAQMRAALDAITYW